MNKALALPAAMPGTLAVTDCLKLQQGKKTALLVTNVVDDSTSISSYGNTQAIQRGYNAGLDNFAADADSTRQLFVSTLLINRGWLYQGKTPPDAPRLDDGNYVPNGNTPLFSATAVAIDFVARAAAYMMRQGVQVYSFTNILTDGADTTNQPPSVLLPWVTGLQQSGNHIVTGIAVRDGRTDFFQVFQQMGIPEQWIKVVERQEGDIVAGVGGSMSAATQSHTVSAGAWTRSTMTGFYPPD